MNTEESRALVKEAWKRFAERDVKRIADLFHEDAEWKAPPANATALALNMTDHMRGSAEIADFLAHGFRRLFTESQVRFTGLHADGSFVIVEEEMSATLPNGVPYQLSYCFVFECRDGRIARVREYMDTQSGFRQVFSRGHPLREAG
jgi:ketosteroid isomerase-like protein